jgi:hypothetical protein
MMSSFKKYMMIACAALSILILLDTLISKDIEEVVMAKTQKFESHNNASRNSHMSYQLKTTNYRFYISKKDYDRIEKNSSILLSISPIFNEVNKYNQQRPLLRTMMGLILPVIVIIGIILGRRFQARMSTLTFVLEVLIIADFIYLLN